MPSTPDKWTSKNSSEKLLQKSEEELPKETIVNRNVSHLARTNPVIHHQPIMSDVTAIPHFVRNQSDSRSSKKHRCLPLPSYPIIVERNGKQFYVKSGQRIERRYVQLTDPMTYKIRYFEVTDFIPYLIIRRYRYQSQSLRQNDTSQRTYFSTLQL